MAFITLQTIYVHLLLCLPPPFFLRRSAIDPIRDPRIIDGAANTDFQLFAQLRPLQAPRGQTATTSTKKKHDNG